jgi:hypothetical protein
MLSPRGVAHEFKAGMSLDDIARKHGDEPEFVEAILRAVFIGFDMGLEQAERLNRTEG